MTLSDLIQTIAPLRVTGPGRGKVDPDLEIGSIHYRAQAVRPGGLFVAIKGFRADGHHFIDDALANGASTIVSQKPIAKDCVLVEVSNTRKALASLASQFYGNPSEKMTLIGITGTNGKTTTAFLIESILSEAGFRAGVIGTINYRYAGKTFFNPMTTPESLDLQRILREMREDGVTHVIMEVSSHALDLFRVDHCWMDLGVFTNLSRDHLDYHKDMAAYWSTKRRLFSEILRTGPKKEQTMAILNCSDEKGRALLKMFPENGISVGRSPENMIRMKKFEADLNGIRGKILTPDGSLNFESPLMGEYNVENILCAVGVGFALNLPLNTIQSGIESLRSVPGRFEPVPNGSGRFVFVDYAHTPGALENVLDSLRSMTDGRIICVFGCGGDRDRDKRPQMGETAGRLCDLAILTSDNPRSEEPMEIIRQIRLGTEKSSSHRYRPSDLRGGFKEKGFVVETDRRNAIRLGISVSGPGDAVLIAGKGHENYQIIGEKAVSFDDRLEAEAFLYKIA